MRCPLQYLLHLSRLIPQGILPLKEWINIIPKLSRCFGRPNEIDSLVELICLNCVTERDVTDLVCQRTLDYWNCRIGSSPSIEVDPELRLSRVISHLRTIDKDIMTSIELYPKLAKFCRNSLFDSSNSLHE